MSLPVLINHAGRWLGLRLKNNFYLYLAALFSLFVLIDASVFHVGENMRQKAFDLVVKQRLLVAQPDPDIVIVDIDEKSIAAMAGDYGRWPWPRQVFGEFVEKIEAQQPKAIVFDILFSDPDLQNPDSDAYFERAIAATKNTYFPFLRLSPQDDGLSQIKPQMIKGITPAHPSQPAQPDATLAVVLPNFQAALNSGRMGTINIQADKDGTVREYRLWSDDHGWRIPSLPFTVHKNLVPANDAIVQLASPKVLLNWRGKPFTYHYVSFADVFADMGREHPTRPVDEFKNKIVILGSTAPSLADIKATPMDRAFPGVEILATAIDNLKHQDYLGTWQGALPYVLFSLLLLWLTALAFYRRANRDKLNRVFSLSQIGLLLASYITINLLDWYLDVTGPLTWALLFFSVAKIYALITERALQRNWLDQPLPVGEVVQLVALLPFDSKEVVTPARLDKVSKRIEQLWRREKYPITVSILAGQQQQLWGLYSDVVLVHWLVPANATKEGPDLAALLAALSTDKKLGVSAPPLHARHHFAVDAATAPLPQWRRALSQLLAQL